MKKRSEKIQHHMKHEAKAHKPEARDDKEFVKSLKKPKRKKHEKSAGKIAKVEREFKEGKLHSGSKKGPVVTSRKQSLAIALNEARKAGEKVAKKRK